MYKQVLLTFGNYANASKALTFWLQLMKNVFNGIKKSYNMVTAIGLPLLIVNGKFQSLGSMSVEDLETFIPYLVKCSINKAGAHVINGVPEWWSSIIQFKFPLKKPKGLSQIGYRRHLSSIVCSCYWYHDAQYLLPFCAKIANSPETVFLTNNEDNTTSIFYVHNTSHIMKFNNENKIYDSKPKKEKPQASSKRRCLLYTLPKKPNIIPDIYLCENCDAELSSHAEMQKHEKECYKIINDNVSDKCKIGSNCNVTKKRKNESLKEVEILQHIKKNSDPSCRKNTIFNYLKLQTKSKECSHTVPETKNGMGSFYRHWVNGDLCSYKNRNIEFSSDFGRKLLQLNYKPEVISKIKRNAMISEFYCKTSCSSKPNREHRESMDFKVTCKKPKKGNWTHQYCFSKKQRRSRYITLKTGLNESSRKLLTQCKGLKIVLNRLNFVS